MKVLCSREMAPISHLNSKGCHGSVGGSVVLSLQAVARTSSLPFGWTPMGLGKKPFGDRCVWVWWCSIKDAFHLTEQQNRVKILIENVDNLVQCQSKDCICLMQLYAYIIQCATLDSRSDPAEYHAPKNCARTLWTFGLHLRTIKHPGRSIRQPAMTRVLLVIVLLCLGNANANELLHILLLLNRSYDDNCFS